jgi:hypothetical protein
MTTPDLVAGHAILSDGGCGTTAVGLPLLVRAAPAANPPAAAAPGRRRPEPLR